MTANLDLAYGTKILNHRTKEIGLLIKAWENKFADKNNMVCNLCGYQRQKIQHRT